MELGEFTQALGRLSIHDLHRLAAVLDARSSSAAGEVDAWRATLGIDRALRRAHLMRVAARAASDASHAVQRAAAGRGVRLPDAEVTHVARAAAEVARGLIAGPDAAGEVRHLLGDWAPVLGVAV